MFCPKCYYANPCNAIRCVECAQALVGLRDRIFIGNQFIFVRADDTHPMALSVDGAMRTFQRPSILSRHRYGVGFGDQAWGAQVTVTPKEKTIAPLVCLFLPGNLALLKGGANAQTAYLPMEGAELSVDAVAVRPGKAKLYVTVHDMYDAAKVGTAPGIKITVRESP